VYRWKKLTAPKSVMPTKPTFWPATPSESSSLLNLKTFMERLCAIILGAVIIQPYIAWAPLGGAEKAKEAFPLVKINGRETNFQNSAIRRLCQSPYFEFYALRDIAAGEEIWSSYGPNYDYDRFMHNPDVKEFFCRRAKIDCREKYSYDH
jgi:hypothetical protein